MATANDPIARISGVSHHFGKLQALRDASIDLPAGQMVALIGPDGAGKSTLLGLIAGTRKIQTGTIRVLGGDMGDAAHRRDVCTQIAYMPQGLGKNLYQEISVAENLAFFGTLFGLSSQERAIRTERLATATGLLAFLDRPAGKLSGGMKQKLGLCCALIHDPDLLILDEPTTGVDPLSRRQFWTLIADLRRERSSMSVIVSTAYMDEASECDWLVAMDEGRILTSGTPAELRASTGEQDLEAVFTALQAGEKTVKAPLVIPPRPSSTEPPIIVAKELTCRFGKFTAVDRVSFTIEKGEIFGFLGSNGCGKTTTMKMLTGLLAPSEGEATVCGKLVDAHDLSIRRRVGFMSQSFSLYGELTVRQNLLLHARLFHLPEADAKVRIEKLVTDTGLTGYADSEAGSLPLGVRQRLSLAVAIVHDPELLILDEPTSGVDPQARDEFWRLLVDLSRNRGVTIFVSTHFMNEAMRCDRISLMHAGRVLVCDAPEAVIASRRGANLEEAFISYIEEAESSQSSNPATAPSTTIVASAEPLSPAKPAYMPLRRLLAYSQCETRSLLRDPIRLAFAFLGSFVMLLIFGFGMSNDVTNLTFAALDHDNTPESRSYLANFSSSNYFVEKSAIGSLQELEGRLRSNDITLAIEIPPNFGRMVKRGDDWQVSAWIDGANTSRAATIEGYVEQAHNLFSDERERESSSPSTSEASTSIQVRYRYNPTAESIYGIGPSVPAMLLMMFLAILMAVSVAREKEIGTIANFYATPTTRLEFLLGKQLPYIGVGMANFAIMTITVWLLFGVPLKGSVVALTLGALLYTAAASGYGLFISSFTKSQVAAVFAAAVLSLLPTMQFSGMMQPVSTLEGAARLMGNLWPTSYYMQISVGAFTKGLGFGDLSKDLLLLTLFAPAFLVLSLFFLKKQEK
ncbi:MULTISPECIES: ribosome-associated ATPase/putative transporter RbbA [Rhizobium/Agrobacterium group]|uniref:ABC transporter nucleotide binding/ATPase protein n=2 Tax=Rhizobium/Agrobacterium group TaxID=227290 RepID=B9K3Q5_ALLAM|nr:MULTISPECIES: ribosome-associated ATPase/putative transporter RbbA [Rhizobium/Agrobacterium group]ACM39503.1 ABC transporter nucleotide binding/ATPase protein [Allorhizobium ampelinum S4]MCF1448979.1 ribosome-associated ATPase/putative transporter RbbA [Allorhizobium ampelinum]MUO31301.1 ribosome-associated ATPase/putative transporter RbbA [Agrobacterium vitis]MUO44998.1 ribosome-associated ATPase/putative transporter RbbA [Agrobacterium vitis]MUP13007.1 ribosome-associated ATPase/putative 